MKKCTNQHFSKSYFSSSSCVHHLFLEHANFKGIIIFATRFYRLVRLHTLKSCSSFAKTLSKSVVITFTVGINKKIAESEEFFERPMPTYRLLQWENLGW